MATVYIPSLMQSLTNGRQTVVVAGSTVREVVNNLEAEYPGIKDRLVDKFRIKPNISVAVDGEVTPIGILEKVGEDSEVHFLPAIGGGSGSMSPYTRLRCLWQVKLDSVTCLCYHREQF